MFLKLELIHDDSLLMNQGSDEQAFRGNAQALIANGTDSSAWLSRAHTGLSNQKSMAV